jgi:hypothetical protein
MELRGEDSAISLFINFYVDMWQLRCFFNYAFIYYNVKACTNITGVIFHCYFYKILL